MDKPVKAVQRLTLLSLLLAVALLLGWLESLFPLPFPIPGIKLGLSNVAVLFALHTFGKREAFLLLIAKVTLSSMLFAGFAAFYYALAGGLLSFLVMWLLLTQKSFSVFFVSIIGAICHNLGQVAAAAVLLGTTRLLYLLSILLFSGLITGALTGMAAMLLLKKLNL